MTRVPWIDITKGFCIVLVVISHITGVPGVGKYLFAPYVTVFYFLSGAVYRNKRQTFCHKILNRSKKLLNYYCKYGLVVIIVAIGISYVEGDFSQNIIWSNLVGLLYSRYSIFIGGKALLNELNSTFWFITSSISSYIFFEVLLQFRKKHSDCFVVIFFVLLSVVMDLCPILLPWSIDTAPFGALMMFIGYKTTNEFYDIRLDTFRMSTLKFIALLCLYVIFCSINTGINFSIREYGSLPYGIDCITFLVISILGTLFYIFIAKIIEHTKISRLFLYLGKNTIHILCLHLVVVKCYKMLLNLFKVELFGIHYWISASLCAMLSISIPLLLKEAKVLVKEKKSWLT